MKGVEGAHINAFTGVGWVLLLILRILMAGVAAYYSNYFMTNAVR